MGNSADGKPAKQAATLTQHEKDLIAKYWFAHIHKDEFIAAKVFDQLFTDSPQVKDAFSNFKDIDVEDEHYNEVLHRHGSRVKSSVGKIIEVLNSPREYRRYLHKLGCRHYKDYKFEPSYIEVVLKYFLAAIEETMGDDWNSELESAFTKLFDIISFYMVNSLTV